MLANLANIVNLAVTRCSKLLNQMFHTGPNRPLVYIANEKTPQSRIVGGNTVVFNPEFLFQIDHPDLPEEEILFGQY